MVSPLRERLDLLIVAMIFVGQSFGNEYMMTCSRPGKTPRLLKLDLGLPCDLSVESWCNLPGEKYPWHAVRSFVFENQGLMRRMYGEVRQLSVLRMEFNGNSIDENSSVGREFDELFKPVSPTTTTTTSTTTKPPSSTTTTVSTTKTTMSSPSTSFSTSAESSFPSSSSPHTPFSKNVHTENENMTAPSSSSSSSSSDLQSDKNNRSVSSGDGVNKNDDNNNTNNNSNDSDDSIRGEEHVIKSIPSSSPDFNNDNLNDQIQTTTTEESGRTEGTTLFDQHDVDNSAETSEMTTEAVHILFQDAERTTINSRTSTTTPTATAADDVDSPQQIHRSDIKGVNACPVKEEVVAPYWANNTRGEVLALLNLYPFEQYIHWEKCTFEHRQMYCREGCRCEQQYRLHRLLAFDPTNECRGIFSDWFRFPSCCVCKCYLTSSDLAQERFSFNRSPRFDDTDVPDVNGVDDSHFYYKTANFFNLRQPR